MCINQPSSEYTAVRMWTEPLDHQVIYQICSFTGLNRTVFAGWAIFPCGGGGEVMVGCQEGPDRFLIIGEGNFILC